MALASPPPRPPVDPDDVNALNSKNIQWISFKVYMRVNTPLRYVAIEIWYPLRTRTTAFAAKRHSYPPNLQNAISPQVMVWLLSNFIQRWRIWSYIKKMSMTRLTPKLHSLTTLVSPKSSNCNISISNGPIAFKFYTEVKNLKLHKTRYVPRNMGMPPACKVCMSYIFHAYTINKSNLQIHSK